MKSRPHGSASSGLVCYHDSSVPFIGDIRSPDATKVVQISPMYQETERVPKPLILCIDDEELGLRVRQIVLERAGYRVAAAPDGPLGLSIFAKERVDLVVLDYSMPGMHGGAVAEEMRRLRPEVPIILLSAYVNLPPEVTRTVDCTVLKGDGPEVLLTQIRSLLPRRAGEIRGEEELG